MSGETVENNKQSSNVFGKVLDGAQIMYGMKDKKLEGFAERTGAVLSVAIPTVLLNDRFRIKPALKELPQAQREAVTGRVFGGSLTIGK
jgi:hypothetical protein